MFKVFSIYDLGLVTSPSIFGWQWLSLVGWHLEILFAMWQDGTSPSWQTHSWRPETWADCVVSVNKMALGGGHQKDPIKAEPMKSNDLSKVMAAQRMLKWGSRWVQHLSSCGVTWFLPCFTCRCVLICVCLLCLQMAMTPCHQCPKTHLQSSSTRWLIGDFYSIPLWGPAENLKICSAYQSS